MSEFLQKTQVASKKLSPVFKQVLRIIAPPSQLISNKTAKLLLSDTPVEQATQTSDVEEYKTKTNEKEFDTLYSDDE